MPAIANAGSDVFYTWGTAPATVNLTGSGTPVAPNTIASYAWTIQSWPSGSTPTFVDTGTIYSALQNPVLQGLPTVGEVESSLVVTDSGGNVSETALRSMPDSARVTIGVKTRYLGLRMLGAKSRAWTTAMQAWLAAIDTMRSGLDFLGNLDGPKSSIVAATRLCVVPGVTPLAVLDGVTFKSRVASTVAVGNGGEVQVRVAPDGLDLVADGTTLATLSLATGFVRIRLDIDVTQAGATGLFDWTFEATTSAGWPSGQVNENGSGVSMDLSAGIQIGLVAVNDGTFGASSSVEATLAGARRSQ